MNELYYFGGLCSQRIPTQRTSTRSHQYDCGCSVHDFINDESPHMHLCRLHISADELAGILVELEQHAANYGGVPLSADKLWARVRAVLTNALGPRFTGRFGGE